MKTIKLIAISAMLMGASATFAHEDADHGKVGAPAVKEQKIWGIAGDAQAVQHTITVTPAP